MRSYNSSLYRTSGESPGKRSVVVIMTGKDTEQMDILGHQFNDTRSAPFRSNLLLFMLRTNPGRRIHQCNWAHPALVTTFPRLHRNTDQTMQMTYFAWRQHLIEFNAAGRVGNHLQQQLKFR